MNEYEQNAAHFASGALAIFAQGKPFTETTLLKDLNSNPDAIKQAFIDFRILNNPRNIDMITVGLNNTVAELRKQYYDLRWRDMIDYD